MERETYYGSNPEKPSDEGPEIKDKEKKERKLSFLDELLEKRKQREAKEREEKDGDDSAESKKKEPTKKELAKEFLEHKAEELKDEIAFAPTTEKKAEIQADLELVEAISEKIDNPYREVEPAVEEAYQELMEALDEESPDDIEEIQENRNIPIIPLSEVIGDDEELTDEEDATSTPTSSPVSTNSTTSTPISPTTNPVASTPFTGSTQARSQPLTSSSPDGATPLPIETKPKTTPEINDRRRIAGKMLVAGALGYVVGRHGGRKRTEAKLQPEIKKRDVTIKELEKNIESKEYQIRSTAREQMKNSYQDTQTESPTPIPVIEKNSVDKNVPEHIVPSPIFFEQPTEPTREVLPELNEEQFTPPESVFTRGESYSASTELHELTSTNDMEKTPHFKPEVKKSETPIPKVEQLSTPDLLNLAEKITVLDTNVRKLYETNQINRQGLEEVVKTHLSGRDIAPVLDRRLLGAEISRERAREFKHDPGGSDDSLDVVLSNLNKNVLEKEDSLTAPPSPLLTQTSEDNVADTENDSEQPTTSTPPLTLTDPHEKTHKTVAISATVIIALIVALFVAFFLLSS